MHVQLINENGAILDLEELLSNGVPPSATQTEKYNFPEIFDTSTDIVLAPNTYHQIMIQPKANSSCDVAYDAAAPVNLEALEVHQARATTKISRALSISNIVGSVRVTTMKVMVLLLFLSTTLFAQKIKPLTWSNIEGKPTFSSVATSGNYADLSNKPLIPIVPTGVSAFTNDANYVKLTSFSATLPLNYNNSMGVFGINQANTTTNGFLSSTDWNIFNSKFNLPALTNGSVLFSNSATVAQNNANLFWDNANVRLGVGTNVPTAKVHVVTSNPTAAIVAVENGSSASQLVDDFPSLFVMHTANNNQYFSLAYKDDAQGTCANYMSINSTLSFEHFGTSGTGWLGNNNLLPYGGISFGGTAYQPNGVGMWADNTATFLRFGASNTLKTSSVATMSLDKNNGRVGIGILLPTEKLDVGGNINFNGALKANNIGGTSGQFLKSLGDNVAPEWTTFTNSFVAASGSVTSTVNGVSSTPLALTTVTRITTAGAFTIPATSTALTEIYHFFFTGTATATLPAAATNLNRMICISNHATGTITTGTYRTANGNTPTNITAGNEFCLVSDGTEWFVVAN